MALIDFRTNTQVRRILVKRWIDTSRVEFGTTNGVVYVKGIIGTPEDHRAYKSLGGRSRLDLLIKIEKEIRRLPDVKDVVFKLVDYQKSGGRWVRKKG